MPCWDPTEGNKIGWKARLLSGTAVQDGRITNYDPYSHKHKIDLDVDEENCSEDSNAQKKKRKNKKTTSFWVRLQHADTQIVEWRGVDVAGSHGEAARTSNHAQHRLAPHCGCRPAMRCS